MPFQTYSLGMQARLSFAVAISVEPEILIIDEALAAGDSAFIAKCFERIREICASGATVLFVSHNTYLVQRLCGRALWIEGGRLAGDGDPATVCRDDEAALRVHAAGRAGGDGAQPLRGRRRGRPAGRRPQRSGRRRPHLGHGRGALHRRRGAGRGAARPAWSTPAIR